MHRASLIHNPNNARQWPVSMHNAREIDCREPEKEPVSRYPDFCRDLRRYRMHETPLPLTNSRSSWAPSCGQRFPLTTTKPSSTTLCADIRSACDGMHATHLCCPPIAFGLAPGLEGKDLFQQPRDEPDENRQQNRTGHTAQRFWLPGPGGNPVHDPRLQISTLDRFGLLIDSF
jgi:hypothetical protein